MAAAAHRPPRLAEAVIACAAYAVAACALLYPVFVRGGEVYAPALSLARPIASWVMWVLAWDVHALFDSSVRLFDANVFHPAPNALAFGESLLGALPFFAPVYALTGNPVTAYQCTLLATLALCGASMYALARHWGLGAAAAAIAGLIYAFCPVRLGVLAEFAYVSGQYLPLAFLFADRLLAQRPRPRDAVFLFLFAAWQVLCGTQLAYAALIALVAYVLSGAVARRPPWRGALLALAAAGGAVAILVLVTAPYRAVVDDGLFTGRTMWEFAAVSSADPWRAFLVPPYASRLGIEVAGGSLYLGVAVLAFAAIGAAVAGRVAVQLLAVGGLCYWLSLGPDVLGGALSPYRWALATLPGFPALGPEPVRFALFAMVAVAGLAAFGVERLQSMARRGRSFGVAAAVLCAAAILVDYRIPFQRFETQRVRVGRDELPLYAALAEVPRGPVLELPVDPCAVTEVGAAIDRQLGSTLHWHPLLDGHQSYDRAPATWAVVRAIAAALPDPRALRLLQRTTGLRYVVVHLTELPGEWRHRWRSVDGLTRLGFFGHDLLFEVTGAVADDLRGELLALPRRRTLTGIAAETLDQSQRAARFGYAAQPPRTAAAGHQVRAEVLVENRSASTWPSLTTDASRQVHLSYLWTDGSGGLAGGEGRAQLLPLDLGPGDTVAVPVCVQVPAVAGDLDLAFGLTQGDQWFADFSEKIRIRVQ
jgi:hypothetical protein